MKNVLILAALAIAAAGSAQDVYVPGHFTKSGKWVEGAFRKHRTKDGYGGLSKPAPEPRPLINPHPSPSAASRPLAFPKEDDGYVPGHFTKSGKWVAGHTRKRRR